MKIFNVEIKLEIEWIDLERNNIGIICNMTKDGGWGTTATMIGQTARIILDIPPNIIQQIQTQVEPNKNKT